VLGLDKKSLSERNICTKFITPAVEQAGGDVLSQIREEVYFTKGRIIVRGNEAAHRFDLAPSRRPEPALWGASLRGGARLIKLFLGSILRTKETPSQNYSIIDLRNGFPNTDGGVAMKFNTEAIITGAIAATGLCLLAASPSFAITINLFEVTETQASLDPELASVDGPFTFITDCPSCNSNGVLTSIQQILLPGTYDFKTGDKFTISYGDRVPGHNFAHLIPLISNFQSDTGDFDKGESLVETLKAWDGFGRAPNRSDFEFTPPGINGRPLEKSPSTALTFVITSRPEAAPEPSTLLSLLTGCAVWAAVLLKRKLKHAKFTLKQTA
jgi:hypothetical protein